MPHINFEFKAKASDLQKLETILLTLNPRYAGEDRQTDTYFNVSKGRLKLREGNIENALIYYERNDTPTAKKSEVILYQHQPAPGLKEILTKVHGIKTVVVKRRKIYFVDNVKIHFDEVQGLGAFVEVEAISKDMRISIEQLKQQCNRFAALFEIKPEDHLAASYSDMVVK